MMDAKTWGLIKVIGGLVALWWVWPFAWKTVQGAVAILAILTIIGGAYKAWGKGK
ncbi:MAG: hypothetical protein QXH80_03305 [Candidatus Nanoarchaeia archaeon]